MRPQFLKLEGYRGLGELEIEFGLQNTVFVGRNGAGKSSLLDAIAAVYGAVIESDLHLQNPRPLGLSDRAAGRTDPTRIAARLRGDTAVTLVELEFDGTARSGQVRRRRLKGGSRRKEGLGLVSYQRASRLWAPSLAEVPVLNFENPLSAYIGALDPSSREIPFLQWMRFVHTNYPSLLDSISDAMAELVPLIDGNVVFDPRLETVVITARDGASVPLRSAADGVRSLVALCGDLLWRAQTLSSTWSSVSLPRTPGVLIIDEMDLHLHPAWQREALLRLRSRLPQLSIVGTTHSPFAIAEFSPGEVRSLSGGEFLPGASLEDIAEELMGVAMPQRSRRRAALEESAAKYFTALETGAAPSVLAELRRRVLEDGRPFAGDAAAIAMLELSIRAASEPGSKS